LATVPASSVARRSPAAKNRVLVTSTPAPPSPEPETQPNMARLTAVLAACFVTGVAWPIAGGLEFVQRPPGSSAPKPPEAEGSSGDGEPAPAATRVDVPALHAAPFAMGEMLQVEKRVFQSCESEAGEALSRCDAPHLDRTLDEPLAKLGACGRAQGASGVLSLGMYLDFSRGHVVKVKAGQSSTLSETQMAMLLGCAEEHVVGTALDGVKHEHAR
jgi:hypothetical protein